MVNLDGSRFCRCLICTFFACNTTGLLTQFGVCLKLYYIAGVQSDGHHLLHACMFIIIYIYQSSTGYRIWWIPAIYSKSNIMPPPSRLADRVAAADAMNKKVKGAAPMASDDSTMSPSSTTPDNRSPGHLTSDDSYNCREV